MSRSAIEPAFPHPGGSRDSTVQTSHLGMSLRDWFAGQYVAGCGPDMIGTYFANEIARQAYEMADAMLIEREK